MSIVTKKTTVRRNITEEGLSRSGSKSGQKTLTKMVRYEDDFGNIFLINEEKPVLIERLDRW